MHPTTSTLARILSRTAAPPSLLRRPLRPPPNPKKIPTLIQQLLARRQAALEAGRFYPSNLRIEEPLKKGDWNGVPGELRKELKEKLKKRVKL